LLKTGNIVEAAFAIARARKDLEFPNHLPPAFAPNISL